MEFIDDFSYGLESMIVAFEKRVQLLFRGLDASGFKCKQRHKYIRVATRCRLELSNHLRPLKRGLLAEEVNDRTKQGHGTSDRLYEGRCKEFLLPERRNVSLPHMDEPGFYLPLALQPEAALSDLEVLQDVNAEDGFMDELEIEKLYGECIERFGYVIRRHYQGSRDMFLPILPAERG